MFSQRHNKMMSGVLAGAFLFACATLTYAAQGTIQSRYIHSGRIVGANIQKSPPKVINISPYEPPSTLKGPIAYASVTLLLDDGRSLGTYDYVLKDSSGKKTYSCMAIAVGKSPFDAHKWRILKISPKIRYTLLFKVPYNSAGKNKFLLCFNYPFGLREEIPLIFQKKTASTVAHKQNKQSAKTPPEKIRYIMVRKIAGWVPSQMSRQ